MKGFDYTEPIGIYKDITALDEAGGQVESLTPTLIKTVNAQVQVKLNQRTDVNGKLVFQNFECNGFDV